MTMGEFNEVSAGCIANVLETLRTKSDEYTGPGDVFANFRQAGDLLGCCPEKALIGMMAKHLVSISAMIVKLDYGEDTPLETWQEKITDSIAYLLLLDGMIVERKRK